VPALARLLHPGAPSVERLPGQLPLLHLEPALGLNVCRRLPARRAESASHLTACIIESGGLAARQARLPWPRPAARSLSWQRSASARAGAKLVQAAAGRQRCARPRRPTRPS
jgi:hypothetical protein